MSQGRPQWHARAYAVSEIDVVDEEGVDLKAEMMNSEFHIIRDCELEGSIIALELGGLGLNGRLPAQLADLEALVLLDVAFNPDLMGAIPPGLLALQTNVNLISTSMTCDGGQFSDKDAQSFVARVEKMSAAQVRAAQWSATEQHCVDMFLAYESTVANISIIAPSYEADITCHLGMHGNKLVLFPSYMLSLRCECPGRHFKIFKYRGGRILYGCASPEWIWVLETFTFILMVLFLMEVASSLISKHWSKVMRLFKNICEPGMLDAEGGAGMASILLCLVRSALARNFFLRVAPSEMRDIYVVMCTVKDVEEMKQWLTPEQIQQALNLYRAIVANDLRQFSGWLVHVPCVSEDPARVVVAFHDLSDAAAWSMTAQQSLTSAQWPAYLQQAPCCKPIHRYENGKWNKIVDGVRASMAINKQRNATLRPPPMRLFFGPRYSVQVLSKEMDDLELLLDIANVCQVVTSEDMKTLENVHDRLGTNDRGQHLSSRQVRAMADHYVGSGVARASDILLTLNAHENGHHDLKSMFQARLAPIVIDLGTHLIRIPSRNHEVLPIKILQYTCAGLYHQSYITGLTGLKSIAGILPSFWQAPGARAFCQNTRSSVVMTFIMFEDYQRMYQPGEQAIAEKALQIFKHCMATALEICNGYECQEVNMVYMLTFATTRDAIRCHLVMQQLLTCADWTDRMLALPPMRQILGSHGEVLFRGPRIKTGIYRGRPRVVSPHSTTGRADYWGPLVNRAARMMSAAKGGQVLCLDGVVKEAFHPASAAEESETMPEDPWTLVAYLPNQSVTVTRVGNNGKQHTMTPCLPYNPEILDKEAKEGVRALWLGHRIYHTTKHTSNSKEAPETSEGAPLMTHSPAPSSCGASCGHPEHQPSFMHEVDIYDLGQYQFKGVSHHFNVKSVNLRCMSERLQYYTGPIKSSKATMISSGKGLERTETVLLPSPAMLRERLRQTMLNPYLNSGVFGAGGR